MKILFVLAACLALTTCYQTEDSGVLVLHDSDFPGIISEFPYILIEFYAPWCGHCQRLAPAYEQAARTLASTGSSIKLAKVDATKDEASASEYGVQGFPTIYYFINGSKIEFTGDRSAEGIVSWVEKKILPATTEVSSAEELEKLRSDGNVNLVLFSTDEETVDKFKAHAVSDDDNRYYIATGELAKRHPEDTIEIYRSFGEVVTHPGLNDRFLWWVNKYSRPAVVDFDDRTINAIFRSSRNAIVLFNAQKNEEFSNILHTVSENHQGDFVFTELQPEHEHYERFAEFIKVNVETPQIVGLLSTDRKKSILAPPLDGLTVEQLEDFLKGLEEGTAKLVGFEEGEGGEEDAGHDHEHHHEHDHDHDHEHEHDHEHDHEHEEEHEGHEHHEDGEEEQAEEEL